MLDDERYEAPPVITEDDVAAGHRTLVLGDVGSGKCNLLAHLVRTRRAGIGQFDPPWRSAVQWRPA